MMSEYQAAIDKIAQKISGDIKSNAGKCGITMSPGYVNNATAGCLHLTITDIKKAVDKILT